MAKTKTSFFCKNCGYESAKWLGKCPSCETWNSFTEQVIEKELPTPVAWREDSNPKKSPGPRILSEIDGSEEPRLITTDLELNRVLGGGIVIGSIILIGGEPGIGKSTLMLQLALSLGNSKVLYVSGEESEAQIKMRANRLNLNSDSCYFLAETGLNEIFKHVRELAPNILIIDSIQTSYSKQVESAPGSLSQVRHCAGEFMKYAKESGTPVFLIGHITKDGAIAGPKVLEHMVDTVLQFEGEMQMAYRILRTTKNRFGSTAELGIYEMRGNGLRQVSNPSEVLISPHNSNPSGISIGATQEGNRSLLIEVQALVSPAAYGTPQRSSTGFESRRLNMLLAVLEKRGGFRLGLNDVFLNMAGGIKVEDPAIDLAVCAAVISSLEDIPLPKKVAFAAEVGLGGELRAVSRLNSRIAEAEKLGFMEIYVSAQALKSIEKKNAKIQIRAFDKLTDVFSDLFG